MPVRTSIQTAPPEPCRAPVRLTMLRRASVCRGTSSFLSPATRKGAANGLPENSKPLPRSLRRFAKAGRQITPLGGVPTAGDYAGRYAYTKGCRVSFERAAHHLRRFPDQSSYRARDL